MTNHDYKAIADRLVEQQLLLQLDPERWPDLYHVEGRADDPLTSGVACHDWRVAGKCLENWPDTRLCNTPIPFRDPLAIILAYLEATDE